jgi:DNA polymerase III subunit epsilon|tara:strand:- start:37504 stop:38817 length:1314 start_codon:yes stop_codon:yes gene_type:complete
LVNVNKKKLYSIIDVETTGGKFNQEGITEIAIYKFDGVDIIDQFISLVNPEIPIQPFVQQLTGITDNMLVNAPKFFQIAKRILEITDKTILVAHNSSFDYRMLKIEFDRLGYEFITPQLCTVNLSKKLIPNMSSYKLGNLVKSLGIPISNRHRASGDAKATLELFKLLLVKDIKKEIFNSSIVKDVKPKINKWADLVKNLKNEIGIYYFHDSNGKIIYIGKSKSIKNRVNQHLTGISNKSLKIRLELNDVSYENTGSELIALLKENKEIKTHQPKFNSLLKNTIKKFGLEICTDNDNFKFLRILHYHDSIEFIETYSSLKLANKKLSVLNMKYNLESNKSEKSNLNIFEILKKYSFPFVNMLIIDKGRSVDEKSVLLIKNNKYIGYGYFTLNYQINNIEILESLITSSEEIEGSESLIVNYINKHKVEKIINIDKLV